MPVDKTQKNKSGVLTLTSSKLFRSGIHSVAIAVRVFLLYTLTVAYATGILQR